jgi:hypothetical protein
VADASKRFKDLKACSSDLAKWTGVDAYWLDEGGSESTTGGDRSNTCIDTQAFFIFVLSRQPLAGYLD